MTSIYIKRWLRPDTVIGIVIITLGVRSCTVASNSNTSAKYKSERNREFYQILTTMLDKYDPFFQKVLVCAICTLFQSFNDCSLSLKETG